MSVAQSDARTRVLARVFGPYVAALTVTALARASDMGRLVSGLGANFLWSWVTGSLVLLIGLVAIASHQCWRSAPAIIVSVLGWLITLKTIMIRRRSAVRSPPRGGLRW